MVYFDANVFVYAALEVRGNPMGDAGRRWLERAKEGEIEAKTSALTWDEVVWAIRKFAGPATAIGASRGFIEMPNLVLLAVDREVVERAHRLAEVNGLRPRDAIHAATALKAGERELVSEDSDFDAVPGLKRIPLVK